MFGFFKKKDTTDSEDEEERRYQEKRKKFAEEMKAKERERELRKKQFEQEMEIEKMKLESLKVEQSKKQMEHDKKMQEIQKRHDETMKIQELKHQDEMRKIEEDRIQIEKKREEDAKKDKIKEIKCIGQASIQGNSSTDSENVKRNKKLAKNRATTIQKFLSRYLSGVKITTDTILPEGEKTTDDVSDILNKLHRSVRVEIHVNVEESKIIQKEVKDAYIKNDRSEMHPTNPYYPKGTGISSNPDYIDGSGNIYYDESELKSRQNYAKLSTFAKSVDYLTFNLKNSYDDNTLNINGVFNAIENFADMNRATKDMSLDLPGSDKLESLTESIGGKDSDVTAHNMDVIAKSGDGIGNGDIGSPLDKNPLNGIDDAANGTSDGNQKLSKIKRYDGESKFFEMLELEEPFLHQKISDKVKYFDPAFHSISPEGFNARLTFLQQCSRQGPTCGSSDAYTNNNTANNLSFGRPPVCILRVGDFYYTKIIIESLTVDFDPLMWDLNAEGIGVMPMIANINMSFKFIGGSSLSGPISRLQNALSFNAYANTEVYDNRAELAEYDNNGNLVKFAPYNPSK
jgi:hypothetical protein